MRLVRPALLVTGIAFGIAAEWASDESDTALVVADFAAGALLVVCGVAAWERRPESRVGVLMVLAGYAWFAGTLFAPALYLHRGPFVQLLLAYPTGRLPSATARAVVALVYFDAAIEPLATNDRLNLVLAGLVTATALRTLVTASGPTRKAVGVAVPALVAFESVLVLGALDRLSGWGVHREILWAYDAVVACTAILLVADLLRARWAQAVVTGLVVDLGASQEASTMRGKLARALGDPSLVVGYRLPETGAFVDDAGLPLEVPSPGSGRAITAVEDGGEPVAMLVHDAGVVADRKLLESVAAAARIAVANARLQAEAQARAGELESSRRRIVEAADAQRRRVEQELRLGTERRLARVAALLQDARSRSAADGDAVRLLARDLDDVRRDVHEFAQGVHPAALTDGGLGPALGLLADRSPVPVTVNGTVARLPEPVEAALYFVCSEALANAVKHASASRVLIEVRAESDDVSVAVSDDGAGGADPSRGSGLRGLADRVEALGGRFHVESSPGTGTRVVAELPRRSSEPA